MAFSTLETVPRITRIRVYTVMQKPPEFSWSPIMPKVLNTDTIVRLTDDSGQDGIGPAMAILPCLRRLRSMSNFSLGVAHRLRMPIFTWP